MFVLPDTTNHVSAVANNFPSAADQLSAALNAPIPFFFAIVAVGVVIAGAIWRAFQWRYDGIIELTRTMLELARTEAVTAKARQTELEATIKSLESKTKTLESKIQQLPKMTEIPALRELQPLAHDLSTVTSTASQQLLRLGQSNNAVTESLSRIPVGLWKPSETTITNLPKST